MSLRGSPIRRLELFSKESASQTLSLQLQIERLQSEITSKNLEIKSLYDENAWLKLNYEEQIVSYVQTIKILENQIRQIQVTRNAEFDVIREKYDRLTSNQKQNIIHYRSEELEFLLREIAHLRVDCAAKDEKLTLKQKQILQITQSFERELQQKISQVNNLKSCLLSIENRKNKEIKEISNQRELQRSRTSGIVQSRKENNQFMDKQIRKLNEEILEKAIKIENLSREINKNKRKAEQSEKILNKKIEDLLAQKEEESKEREQHFARIQKSLRQEIFEYKTREIKFLGELDTLKSKVQTLKAELKRYQETIKSKEQEIKGYKDILERQRQDHAKEISNLMKERRRKSSHLGSSRSLGSSLKDVNTSGVQEISNVGNAKLKKADSAALATVKQEQSPDKSMEKSPESPGRNLHNLIQESHITSSPPQQEENEIAKVIIHYDTLIEELKRSHASEIELFEHKLYKLTKSLDDKQLQLLDMLTRFSPLVKIHAQEKTIEEDRRERIERHWKADLALLQIMLQKYKIKAYQ